MYQTSKRVRTMSGVTYDHEQCASCGLKNELSDFMFCSRCRLVVYCSRDHQVSDYKKHKKICKENIWSSRTGDLLCQLPNCKCKEWSSVPSPTATEASLKSDSKPGTSNGEQLERFPKTDVHNLNLDFKKLLQSEKEQELLESHPLYHCCSTSSRTMDSDAFSESSNKKNPNSVPALPEGNKSRKRSKAKKGKSENTVIVRPNSEEEDWENYAPSHANIMKTTPAGVGLPNNSNSSSVSGKSRCYSSNEPIQPTNSMSSGGVTSLNSTASIPFQHINNFQASIDEAHVNRIWMFQVCHQIITDLDRYGVCVVDNLLGESRGAAILKEVQSLYSTGSFTDGQLVKGHQRDGPGSSHFIRGDKITWVEGREPNCKNISNLIKLLDSIVMGANKLVDSGKLGKYCIKERSKAMIACYPGSGTQYVKHVDNPNDDGRCVTVIYYLNKDWNTKENGGLLRIFPEGWSHQVADIEPLFDRVIFFWSDRRNPHEVQPAFKTRYAITLWYFDSKVKDAAKTRNEVNNVPSVKAAS